MSTTHETVTRERVQDLQRYIAEGKILPALDEFYARDVVMQENLEAPTRGLSANVERERAFLDSVAEWRGFEVKSLAVEGDTSLVETTLDYVTNDGQEVHTEQVSRARWRDGKIVEERFYHG